LLLQLLLTYTPGLNAFFAMPESMQGANTIFPLLPLHVLLLLPLLLLFLACRCC
jgi:hypothetical protein